MKKLILSIFIVFALSYNAFAFDALLMWDIPDEEHPELIKGYEVWYGYSSGQYEKRIDVEGYYTDEILIERLPDGTIHYFAVRTVGKDGTLSEFSNEVNWNGVSPPGGSGSSGFGCFIMTVQ